MCEIETKSTISKKKPPVHWLSKIPTLYKRHSVIGELHRATRIATDFNYNIHHIQVKSFSLEVLSKAPLIISIRIKIIIRHLLIPEWLFHKQKLIILGLSISQPHGKFIKNLLKSS